MCLSHLHIHPSTHPFIHPSMPMHTCKHTSMHAYMQYMPTCVHAYMHRYVRTYIRTYRCITTNKQVIHVPYLYARNSNATHRCSIVQIVSHMLGARHNFLLQFGLEFGESLFCTLAFFRRGYGQGRPPCPRASAPPYVAEDRLSASLSLSLSLMWQITGSRPLDHGGSFAGW